MALANQMYLVAILSMLANDVSLSEMSVIFLCDLNVHDICVNVMSDSNSQLLFVNNVRVLLTGVAFRSSGDFIKDVTTLQRADDHKAILFVGFGRDHVVNAVTCVSRAAGVPAIVYSTSNHRKNIFKNDVISIHPDHEGLAQAIITLLGKQMIKNAYVICENSLVLDGFLEVFQEADELYNRTNDSHVIKVSASDSDLDLRTMLVNVHDTGYRLIIVHSSSELLQRIANIAGEMSYFDAGYAWIITEEAMPDVPLATSTSAREKYIPKGVLAVDGYEVDKYEDLLTKIVEVIRDEISALMETAILYNLSTRFLAEKFRTVLAGRSDVHRQFFSGIKSNRRMFEPRGRRSNMEYRLLNLIEDSQSSNSSWRTVGFIRGHDLELNTVVWPGSSIFGPIINARAFLSIVTRPAEPFMYVRGPVDSYDSCVADTECLEVFTYDPVIIHYIIENFRYNEMSEEYPYRVHCCEGIVVDIIHAMSVEMKFDFILYFQNDQDYGTNVNGSWVGMMGDVMSGAADLMAGAVSITSERMETITFTEAFYFSSFNMVTGNNDRYTTLLAFLNPFHPYVWMMLIVSATTVAISTSLFEWNSPFGLNPWGKRRKKNYTLGSALTMVFSIWFGHTVKTKSPKSWPSKFLQNCWAFGSIFVVSAYTANLAAFLAGNAQLSTIYSILDTRIGIVKTSAAEEHIKTVNPVLQTRFRNNYVSSIDEAFFKLRNKQLDLYIDDSPLIEYALSRFDDNCSIKFASRSFGDNAYAFGMKKGSWLKEEESIGFLNAVSSCAPIHRRSDASQYSVVAIREQLDPLVLDFVELGYVEDLKWRYMGKNRKCTNKLTNTKNDDINFTYKHTAGLFVFLSGAVGLAIVLLILEHITYFVILPRLKKKPPDSIWKKRNVEYFSQRLYKSINSEKVEPPAKVLLSKVKRRKFEIQSRVRRQIRSFPTNLTSHQLRNRRLNHILDMAYKNFYESQNFHSEGDIYTISDSVDDEIVDMLTEINMAEDSRRTSSVFDLTLPDNAYDNPVFEADDIDIVIENPGMSNRYENCNIPIKDSHCNGRVNNESRGNQKSKTTSSRSVVENSRINSESNSENTSNQWRKSRRYETWPSPQTRKRSVKRMQNNNTKSFSNADRENIAQNYRIVNEITGKTCRTCSTTSLDGLAQGKNQAVRLNLKDNRLKSDLRNHAMATTERRRSMAFDQSAVEALSKEDLLVLWKRSEIELQTRLNKMLHQNNHLRRLVHIVEEYQRKTDSERTKQGNENSESESDDEGPPITTTRL